MSLESLQEQLTDAVFRRKHFDESLNITGGEEAFAIYRNNIFVSLIDSLEGLYPLTAKISGDNFANLARDYISAHPPTEAHLAHYGSEFPAYIGRSDFIWGQIATVEKLCNESYYAPASDIITAEKLMNYDEEERLQLPIGLAKSCFISDELPDNLAQAICNDAITQNIKPTKDKSHILIFRPSAMVVKKIISPEAAIFLNRVEKQNWASALVNFMESEHSAQQNLSEFFADGIFALR